MTKYRKSVKQTTAAEKEQKTAEKVVDKKETSGYNPETWTEQFFREKREREAIQKTGTATGQENETSISATAEDARIQKGIPDEKGIPACEVTYGR